MARATFREKSILDQLDRHAAEFDFPTLDNGYIYPVDVRLTAYRDDRRWAIVIEHVGYFNRAAEFGNVIYAYGSGLRSEPGHGPMINLVDGPNNWQDDAGNVRRSLRSVRVRGRLLKLAPEELIPPPGPDGTATDELPAQDLFRRLLPRARDLYLATDADLAEVVPADLPQFLRLDEWEHSDAVRDVLPSHTEFFPMLAKALVTGDAAHYKPTRAPNTHWTNWPDGGTL